MVMGASKIHMESAGMSAVVVVDQSVGSRCQAPLRGDWTMAGRTGSRSVSRIWVETLVG
ncbi:hypothetical protein DESC_260063 [Desulfosarcina cetonica]|nr:hypothetical protein DESC_260063 [Desulfosarcina cetonica]